MRKLLVAAALAATIVTAGIVLVLTSIGGAATKHSAGYPSSATWTQAQADATIRSLRSSSKYLGATALALIAPGGIVFATVGIKNYTHPAPGIHCLKPKGSITPPLLTPVWPATGPAIVSWFIFPVDCPGFDYLEVRVYDPDTGGGTDNAGFLLYLP
jgi:hypothetical protein